MKWSFNYRPQRSCGQGYVFTRVCDSVHGGGVSAPPPGWQGEPPPGKENHHPPGQGDPATHPPRQGEPPRQGDPPSREKPPLAGRTPGQGDPPAIRSMSGRYASYWNAFNSICCCLILRLISLYLLMSKQELSVSTPFGSFNFIDIQIRL